MLPGESVQRMLERQFGIDVLTDTPLGRIYAKGGFWSEGAGVTVEQCNAFFLPKGMELVILANSTFCKQNTGFMGDVINAIRNNIKLDLFNTSLTAVSVLATLGLIGKKVRSKSSKK